MKFLPYPQLESVPNLIVDGQSNAATVLNLSHWPHSGTPHALKDDLSAQIVFRYLDDPSVQVNVDVVSNDHFDEDGLVSAYSIINPEHAFKHRALLTGIAAAGDFGTYKLRDAARVAFTISAYADKNTSPLGKEIFERPYPEMAAELYMQLLPILPDFFENIEQHRQWWHSEDEFLSDSERKINSGQINITEIPHLDLSVVTLPDVEPQNYAHRFAQGRSVWCHPMAINNATNGFRTLIIKGRQYEFQYRYESWVQYVSRRPLPRVDLNPLAEKLTEQEDGGIWKFDGVSKITPSLRLTNAGESRISAENFRQQLVAFLESGAVAWDPYDFDAVGAVQ